MSSQLHCESQQRSNPIFPVATAASDKPFKVHEHRRNRRASRTVLKFTGDGADRRLHEKVYGEPWKGCKGRKYYCPEDPKSRRKHETVTERSPRD